MSSNSCYSKTVFEIHTVIKQKSKFIDICYFDIGYYCQKNNYLLRLFDLPNQPSNGIHQKETCKLF